MLLEAERRPSGVWTVLYQPGIPLNTIDIYQEMFDFLGNNIITNRRYNNMSERGMACFLAAGAYAGPTNNILSNRFGFRVHDRAAIMFSEKIITPRIAPQSGQIVLKIVERNDDFPFAIIDPACYLYDIPYKGMPIAVGDHDFIERAMTEIYSNAIGKPINTRLDVR